MKNHLVSVIMPVRNGERYLGEAMESILAQTFTDFEFIIINDGSTDNTQKIIDGYAEKDNRIICLNHDKGKGLVAALNYGIQEAEGQYIARMDADDISMPERFEKQVKFLDENKNCVVVSSSSLAIDKNGFSLFFEHKSVEHEDILLTILKGRGGLVHAAAMMRKTALEKVGGYNQNMFPAEDWDLWFRLGKIGKFANIQQILYQIRYHIESVCSVRYEEQKIKTMELLEKAEKDFADILPPDFKRLSFPEPMSEVETHIYWSKRACYDGFYKSARKHACKALKEKPLGVAGWKALGRAMAYSFRLKRTANLAN